MQEPISGNCKNLFYKEIHLLENNYDILLSSNKISKMLVHQDAVDLNRSSLRNPKLHRIKK